MRDPLDKSSARCRSLVVVTLLDEVCQVALAAVVPIEVHRHENLADTLPLRKGLSPSAPPLI